MHDTEVISIPARLKYRHWKSMKWHLHVEVQAVTFSSAVCGCCIGLTESSLLQWKRRTRLATIVRSHNYEAHTISAMHDSLYTVFFTGYCAWQLWATAPILALCRAAYSDCTLLSTLKRTFTITWGRVRGGVCSRVEDSQINNGRTEGVGM